MTDPIDAMGSGLAKATGHDLDWWVEQALRSGKERHGELVAHLKSKLGLSHGYANLVAHTALERRAGGPPSEHELIDGQYRGKEGLVPIYERLMATAQSLGSDVEVAPKKGSVSLRRSKQFALIEPATKTRIDLGLNLRGEPGTDRLEVAGGMCTHKVALTDPSQVDDELVGWLREAYSRAGGRRTG